MTSSNGNIFRVTGHLCSEFTGPGEFPAQRPVTRSFDIFFDLHLNKRLSKQSWGWWFEMLSCPLWHHCNEIVCYLGLMDKTEKNTHKGKTISLTQSNLKKKSAMIFFFVFKKKHADILKWKHFPRYWPFVRGIHQTPVRRSFDVFFDLRLNNRLSKLS